MILKTLRIQNPQDCHVLLLHAVQITAIVAQAVWQPHTML
jgi:hypothetical protein